MTTLHHEVKINAAPEKVWNVLANLEAVQYYNPLVAKTRYTSENREGVGASRHCDFKPKGFSKERITDWIPARLLGMEVVESSFPMTFTRWKTHLVAEGGGTRVTQDLEYGMKLGLLGELLNKLMMKKKYDGILAEIFTGLKNHVESN
ncbi:SRPBCC family protein [candidate division KSB1 bacterium]|nr:SRPBCC family protein [candidate division KSB1 bacterium]